MATAQLDILAHSSNVLIIQVENIIAMLQNKI